MTTTRVLGIDRLQFGNQSHIDAVRRWEATVSATALREKKPSAMPSSQISVSLWEARMIVSGRLRFGDAVHIAAVQVWDAEVERQATMCRQCDGSGEHECLCGNSHECGYCDGTGVRQDEE